MSASTRNRTYDTENSLHLRSLYNSLWHYIMQRFERQWAPAPGMEPTTPRIPCTLGLYIILFDNMMQRFERQWAPVHGTEPTTRRIPWSSSPSQGMTGQSSPAGTETKENRIRETQRSSVTFMGAGGGGQLMQIVMNSARPQKNSFKI